MGICLGIFIAISDVVPLVRPASAHPHVFIDGGVDFVFDDAGMLTALSVTWRYDLFETLYALSNLGILPDPDGALLPEDQEKLIKNETEWPEEFEGAARIEVAGQKLALSRPRLAEVDLEGDRLVIRFIRDLTEPIGLEGRRAEITFYEATYYYAFAITDHPKISGAGEGCMSEVRPFDPTTQLAALQVNLAELDREETPEIDDVGALFTDRIVLDCR